MSTNKFPDDVLISGALQVIGGISGQRRAGIDQDNLQAYDLDLSNFRIWDAVQTLLTTSSSDDLGLTAGAFGTGCPYITTGDVKAAGTTTRYARTKFTLPTEYVAGETAQLRVSSGMLTTIADTSASVDFECYVNARTTLKSGSDLVITSPQSINSTSFGEKTFELNAIGLEPGIVLDIRMKITVVDSATVTAVIAAVGAAEIQLDVKG